MTTRATTRQAERMRLITERDRLRAKYPPGTITLGDETPEEVLRYSNEVIRYDPSNAGELYELAIEPPPWSCLPA